jgi:hypothetical protein
MELDLRRHYVNTPILIDNYDFINSKVITYQVFSNMKGKENDDKITITNSIQFKNKLNVALCGGFVRSMIYNTPVNDFDFFIIGIEKEQILDRVKKLINEIISEFMLVYEHALIYKSLTNLFELAFFKKNTFELEHKFQIIIKNNITKKYFTKLEDVFAGFDLNICKMAYYNNGVYITNNSFMALLTKSMYIDNYQIRQISKHRIAKYLKYGFSFSSFYNIDINDFRGQLLYVDYDYKNYSQFNQLFLKYPNIFKISFTQNYIYYSKKYFQRLEDFENYVALKANKQSTEDKTTIEQPTEVKQPIEQPTEDKTTIEQPSEDKPTIEQPTEDKNPSNMKELIEQLKNIKMLNEITNNTIKNLNDNYEKNV